jgi:hypothetical protein
MVAEQTPNFDLIRDAECRKSTFVFFHVGKDVSQPMRLIESILKTNPGSDIVMCADILTPVLQGITQRVNVAGDRDKLMQFRLDAFASVKLERPAIYLDTDMVVREKINPSALLGSSDITVCRRAFQRNALFNTKLRGLDFSEYSGRTLDQVYPYLACATVTRTYKPWFEMAMALRRMDPKFSIWYGDQEALKAYASTKNFGMLSESEYACLPEKVDVRFPPKIIHYKGGRK